MTVSSMIGRIGEPETAGSGLAEICACAGRPGIRLRTSSETISLVYRSASAMNRAGSANSRRSGSTSGSSCRVPTGGPVGSTTRPSGKPGCVTSTWDVLLYWRRRAAPGRSCAIL